LAKARNAALDLLRCAAALVAAALVQGNSLSATFYSLFYRVELMNP
jgi:hypothetical protein